MKLVRDLIPSIIEKDGKSCEFHVAGDSEYRAELYKKMIEEFDEFVENPCMEEAADMYEVLLALCAYHKFTILDVLATAEQKKQARGGFEKRLILRRVINESR